MIGVEEIPSTSCGGKAWGYRSRSGGKSAVAADGREASCWAMAEVLSRQLNTCVAESVRAYGRRVSLDPDQRENVEAIDRGVSKLGDWISYLEDKYNLAS